MTGAQSRLAAFLRVASVLTCLFGTWAFALAYRAHARADELIRDAGVAMLTYARAQHLDTPRTLMFNGAALRFVSGSTDDSPKALLDAFEERCTQVATRAEIDPRALPKTPLVARSKLLGWNGALRHDGPDGGYVACIDAGGKLSALELRDRLRSFVASRNLAALGDLRFAWAHVDHGHTGYVGVVTQGSLSLGAMFPSEGDAPGQDPPGLPRPTESRRTLSAWQEDEAPMLTSYAARVAPEDLLSSYPAQLLAAGFSVRELRAKRAEPHVLLLTRSDQVASAVISGDERESSVTLIRLR